MTRRFIIHRGLDEQGAAKQPISLEQWRAVAGSYPQLTMTNQSTKGQPYEGMAEWRRGEAENQPVRFQPYCGVIFVNDAPDDEQPLFGEIAEALKATLQEVVEDDFECENVRLEFETPQDYGNLFDLDDILNDILAAADAGEIIGTGYEHGITSRKSNIGEALEEMKRERIRRDGDRLCFAAFVLSVQTSDIERLLQVLQTALPKTGRIPTGTRVLIESEDGEFELRFTL